MEYQDDNNDFIDEENQDNENKQQIQNDEKVQIQNDQAAGCEQMSKRSIETEAERLAQKNLSVLVLNNPNININNWDPQKIKNIIQSKIVDFRDRDVSMIAINILPRPVKTKQEKNFLMKGIQGLQLFQENKDIFQQDQMNHQLFKEIQLKCFKKNEVIFNIGDHGTTYFIILLGSVFCLLREATQQQQPPQHDNNSIENSHGNESKINGQDNNLKKLKSRETLPLVTKKISTNKDSSIYSEEEQEDLYQIKKIYPNLECVKIYKPGEAFGEISLMTNSSRTATMVCREDTYLMTLNKQGFEKIMGAYHEYVVRERLAFLQKFSFFKEIHPSKLLSILHFMNIEKYEQKNIIYRQGDEVEYIYFIKQGEIELFTNISLDPFAQDEEGSKSFSPSKSAKYNIVDQNKMQKKLKKKIPISILGPNNIFGEEEIEMNINKRKCEAVVYSLEATLFVIRKDKLMDCLKLNNTLDIFLKTIENRQKFTADRQTMMIHTLDLEQKAKSLIQQNMETENMMNKLKMESNFYSNQNILENQDQEKEDIQDVNSPSCRYPQTQRMSILQKQECKSKHINCSFTPRKSILQHIRGSFDSPNSKGTNHKLEGFQQSIDQLNNSYYSSPRQSYSKDSIKHQNSIFNQSPQSPRFSEFKDQISPQNSIFHNEQKQQLVDESQRRATASSLINKSRINEIFHTEPYGEDSIKQDTFSTSPRGKRIIHQSRKLSPDKTSNVSPGVNDSLFTQSSQQKQQNNEIPLFSDERNCFTSKKSTIPNLDSNNYFSRRESDLKVLKLLEKNGLLGNQIQDIQSKLNFNENLLKYIEEKTPNSSQQHNIFNIVTNEIESQAKYKKGILCNQLNIFSISDDVIQQRINTINSKQQFHPKKQTPLQNGNNSNLNHLKSKYQLIKQKFFNRDLNNYCSNTQIGLNATEVSSEKKRVSKNNSYFLNNLQKQDQNEQLINIDEFGGPTNQKSSLRKYLRNIDRYADKRGKTSNQNVKQPTRQQQLLEEIVLNSIDQSFTDSLNTQKTQKVNGVDTVVENNLDLEKPSFIDYNSGEITLNKDQIFENNSYISEIVQNSQDQNSQNAQLQLGDNQQNENFTNLSRQNSEKTNQLKRRASQEDVKSKLKKLKLVLPLSKNIKNEDDNYIFQSLTQRNILGSQKQSAPDFSQPYTARENGQQPCYLKQYCLLNKLGCKKNQSSNATKITISTERQIPQQKESLVMSSAIKFEMISRNSKQNTYRADQIIQNLKKENNITLPSINQTESINAASNISLIPSIQHSQTKTQISQSQNFSQMINSQIINKQNKNLNISKGSQKQQLQMQPQGMNIHYTTKKAKNDFFSQIFKNSDSSRNHLLNHNLQEIADKKLSVFDQSQGINIYGLQSNPVKTTSSQKQNNNLLLK